MSVVKCKKCGQIISDDDLSCSRCGGGNPFKKQLIYAYVLMLAGLAAIGVFFLGPSFVEDGDFMADFILLPVIGVPVMLVGLLASCYLRLRSWLYENDKAKKST
jgi:hypothetical protein